MINEVPLEQITSHLEKLRTVSTRRGFRLVHWRGIIRLAQTEYERELQELESLNSVKVDTALEVPIV